MKTISLQIPDKTYEHLSAVARFENKSFETFAKEVLILAERQIWKTHGHKTKQMLAGLEYFNNHCR